MVSAKRLLITSHVCLLVLFTQQCFSQSLPKHGQIPLWKTVQVGTHQNVIDLREALEAEHCSVANPMNSASGTTTRAIPCRLGDAANEIIGRPAFGLSRTRTQIQLALVSAEDLGFPSASQPTLREIYGRAERLGYALCPPEVGPQLRLQYADQKIGEFINLAMQPIPDYEDKLTVFSLGNGGAGLLLVGSNGSPDFRIPATSHLVFMRPPQPSDAAVVLRSGG